MLDRSCRDAFNRMKLDHTMKRNMLDMKMIVYIADHDAVENNH